MCVSIQTRACHARIVYYILLLRKETLQPTEGDGSGGRSTFTSPSLPPSAPGAPCTTAIAAVIRRSKLRLPLDMRRIAECCIVAGCLYCLNQTIKCDIQSWSTSQLAKIHEAGTDAIQLINWRSKYQKYDMQPNVNIYCYDTQLSTERTGATVAYTNCPANRFPESKMGVSHPPDPSQIPTPAMSVYVIPSTYICMWHTDEVVVCTPCI